MSWVRVLVSGFFDPLHRGHIAYIEAAALLGDVLIVSVNTDAHARAKKGYVLLPLEQRIAIMKSLKVVSDTLPTIGSDSSQALTIRVLKPDVFAKSAGYNADTLPKAEIEACKEVGCTIVYGVGEGVAPNISSTQIMKEFIENYGHQIGLGNSHTT